MVFFNNPKLDSLDVVISLAKDIFKIVYIEEIQELLLHEVFCFYSLSLSLSLSLILPPFFYPTSSPSLPITLSLPRVLITELVSSPCVDFERLAARK